MEVSHAFEAYILHWVRTDLFSACGLGGIEVGPASDVGEVGWILQYAMTLVEPQPVQLLQSGNAQTSTGKRRLSAFNYRS